MSDTDLEKAWTFYREARDPDEDDDAPAASRTHAVTANRLADLLSFYTAYAAFQQFVALNPSPEGETWLAKAANTVRKFAPQLAEGFQAHLAPIAKQVALGPRFDQAMRPASPDVSAANKVEFLSLFLPKAKAARTPLLREAFPGRAAVSVLRTAAATESNDPAAVLAELAQNVPCSGLQTTRKWIEKASALAGVPITAVESTIADATVAADLGARLAEVNKLMAGLDAGSEERAQLGAEKATLLAQIENVAAASNNPTAVESAAVSRAIGDQFTQATKIGAKLGMSEEQETAMLIRGQNVIAAGAGSGKTRVLSGKVVYHMTEAETPFPAHRIMAVSFTRASSNELVERIQKIDGGRLKADKESENGFGSTHSVALKLRRQGGKKWERKGRLIKDAEQGWLMRAAILQVMMKPSTTVGEPDPEETFFPTRPDWVHWEGSAPSEAVKEEVLEELSNALRRIDGYIDYARRNMDWPDKPIARATWAKGWINDLMGRVKKDDVASLSDLGPSEQRTLYHIYTSYAKLPVPIESPVHKVLDKLVEALRNANSYLSWAKGKRFDREITKAEDSIALIKTLFQKFDSGEYKTWKDLDASEKKGIMQYWGGRGSPWKMPGEPPAAVRKASGPPKGADKLYRKGMLAALEEKFPAYSQRPANQWFNLGLPAEAFMEPGDKPKDPPKPISLGEFMLYVTGNKGRLKTPGAAYHEDKAKPLMGGRPMDEVDDDYEGGEVSTPPGTFAAVYAAYQWLLHKDGDEDFDDILIEAARMLVEEPAVLARVNERYKVVLVDEAQDLNPAQHVLFGLVAGQIDPRTIEPREDCQMTADTFSFIGDDKQCVAVSTRVSTPEGFTRAGDLKPGDEVLSYRNGKVVPQRVKHVVPSSWTQGFMVRTEGERVLTMSPNHKIWASEPQTEEGQVAVYLMHRPDMGFRVGITNKGKASEEGYHNSYGGRAFLEKADRLWILDICPDREAALLKEKQISYRYSIPTEVFNAEHRGVSQERVASLFAEFGHNGMKLLEEHHLSFDLPHWMSQSYTKHGRDRRTLHINAHSGSNTQVSMEWSGDDLDEALADLPKSAKSNAFSIRGDRRRLRRYFANYREALAFADEVRRRTSVLVSERLSTPEEHLRLLTASGLHVGMRVAVMDEEGQVSTDTIREISPVVTKAGHFVDLDVEDASNFFGDGILSHNSIYGFRGAEVEEFVGKTRECFKTKMLTMNYRSGSAIVQAANNLMRVHEEHDVQIPMTCNANVERKGEGRITERVFGEEDALPVYVADVISEHCQGDDPEAAYDDYGLLVRTRKEAMAYGVSMVERGIPFRSKHNFFKGPAVVTLLGVMRLCAAKDTDVATVNEVVATAHKALNFQLGATFVDRLEERAPGQNWLTYLSGGGWDSIYGGRASHRNGDFVKPYTDFLVAVRKHYKAEKPDTLGLIDFAVTLETPAGSMIQRLMDRVKASKQDMEEVLNEYEDTSDDSIEQYARGEIAILEAMANHHTELDSAVAYVNVMQGRAEELAVGEDERTVGQVMKDVPAPPPAVRIDTVHGWKGLEAKHVFVPMWEGRFPHMMTDDDGSPTGGKEMEAERRLAYVAITRGEDSVTIIRPSMRMVGDKPKPIPSSRFVSEACITPGSASARPVMASTFRDPETVMAFLAGDDEFDRHSCGELNNEWTFADEGSDLTADWFKTNEDEDGEEEARALIAKLEAEHERAKKARNFSEMSRIRERLVDLAREFGL